MLGKRKRDPKFQTLKKTRRATLKRQAVKRSSLDNNRNVHRYTRYTNPVTYSVPGGLTELDIGEHFTFDQVINQAEFTALYDQYRLDGILLTFQLITNPDSDNQPVTGVSPNKANFFPKIWFYKDDDDANAQTIASLRECAGVKQRVLYPNRQVSFFIRPNILGLTYRTALTSGYAPLKNQWVDAANADVPHYGMKFCIDLLGNTVAGQDFLVRCERKFFFTMKNVR